MFNAVHAQSVLSDFLALASRVPSDKTDIRIREDAWTFKEMISHLVDSAANNHQRFIRLQSGNLESFPGYDAESWVERGPASRMSYGNLLQLWKLYNEFILALIFRISGDCLQNIWVTPSEPKSLAFLMEDYYRHIAWHHELLEKRLAELG